MYQSGMGQRRQRLVIIVVFKASMRGLQLSQLGLDKVLLFGCAAVLDGSLWGFLKSLLFGCCGKSQVLEFVDEFRDPSRGRWTA